MALAPKDVPARAIHLFGPENAARAWKYRLSRQNVQVEGYFFAGFAVEMQKPTLRDVVRDIILGDFSEDDMSEEDTKRLQMLFTEAQIQHLRYSVSWEE